MVEVLETLAELKEGWVVSASFRALFVFGVRRCREVKRIYMHIDAADSPQARRGQRASGEGVGKYDVCNFMAA